MIIAYSERRALYFPLNSLRYVLTRRLADLTMYYCQSSSHRFSRVPTIHVVIVLWIPTVRPVGFDGDQRLHVVLGRHDSVAVSVVFGRLRRVLGLGQWRQHVIVVVVHRLAGHVCGVPVDGKTVCCDSETRTIVFVNIVSLRISKHCRKTTTTIAQRRLFNNLALVSPL